ncbi:hypothetical protein D9M72_438240 [compost metagenome]
MASKAGRRPETATSTVRTVTPAATRALTFPDLSLTGAIVRTDGPSVPAVISVNTCPFRAASMDPMYGLPSSSSRGCVHLIRSGAMMVMKSASASLITSRA